MAARCAAAPHKMKDPRNIAVVGVTGYTGFELARILLRHPEAQSLDLLCARHARRALPDGTFSATARLGGSALRALSVEAIAQERRGHGVSGDSARSFGGTGAATCWKPACAWWI